MTKWNLLVLAACLAIATPQLAAPRNASALGPDNGDSGPVPCTSDACLNACAAAGKGHGDTVTVGGTTYACVDETIETEGQAPGGIGGGGHRGSNNPVGGGGGRSPSGPGSGSGGGGGDDCPDCDKLNNTLRDRSIEQRRRCTDEANMEAHEICKSHGDNRHSDAPNHCSPVFNECIRGAWRPGPYGAVYSPAWVEARMQDVVWRSSCCTGGPFSLPDGDCELNFPHYPSYEAAVAASCEIHFFETPTYRVCKRTVLEDPGTTRHPEDYDRNAPDGERGPRTEGGSGGLLGVCEEESQERFRQRRREVESCIEEAEECRGE